MKLSPEVEYYLHILRVKGGQSKSEAKKSAARKNGTAPVREGSKPRGRPKKQATD